MDGSLTTQKKFNAKCGAQWLQVQYRLKPWYGQVPPYLARRRQELDMAAQAAAEEAERAAQVRV